MSTSKKSLTVAFLIAAALTAFAIMYSLRCPASPPVSPNAIAVAAAVQCAALCLVFWGLSEAEGVTRKIQRSLLWFGIGLFLASLGIAQYATNYSDALGKPNWYKSVG